MPRSVVSFIDTEGIRHTVEIEEAGSLYEAAALAIHAFQMHKCEPGDISKLEVEVRSSVTHTVTPRKVREWLNGSAKTPKEKLTKDRLRGLVSGK
jgi:hypothetical protein